MNIGEIRRGVEMLREVGTPQIKKWRGHLENEKITVDFSNSELRFSVFDINFKTVLETPYDGQSKNLRGFFVTYCIRHANGAEIKDEVTSMSFDGTGVFEKFNGFDNPFDNYLLNILAYLFINGKRIQITAAI